jgi:hypothetical protein
MRFREAQTGIHSRYMWSNELFGGLEFNNIWLAHVCFTTQPTGAVRFGGNYDYGHRIARRFLVMGKEISYGLWADVKPIDRFVVSLSWNGVTSDDLEAGDRLFSQTVLRSRFSLQLLRELSVRVILQYQDRSERGGFEGDTWEVDPLITYQLNPLTVFFVGSTRDYISPGSEYGADSRWILSDRQYFLKLQYLFQI